MSIPIKEEVARSLIRRRFGSVDDAVVEWEHRVSQNMQRNGKNRDRATIYRWLANGLPSQADDIFGFAALLDVDPIALINIDQEYIHEQFGRERRWFRLNRPKKTEMRALWSIYIADAGWPNQPLAETYYARRWCVSDFANDPAQIANVYAAVILTHTEEPGLELPRTYHFAYRRVGVSDRMWRPYGTVIAYGSEIVRITESGGYQGATRTGPPVRVETYFGPGPVEFRVASLHDFELALEVPSTGRPCVRFDA
jgi:hypothetical protein